MKLNEIHESKTHMAIKTWMKAWGIPEKYYTVDEDNQISIDYTSRREIPVLSKKLMVDGELPFKFRSIHITHIAGTLGSRFGTLIIRSSELASLRALPETLDCSLDVGLANTSRVTDWPKTVNGNLQVESCGFEDLVGFPAEVLGGYFRISHMSKLKSLAGSPKRLDYLRVDSTTLTSLEGISDWLSEISGTLVFGDLSRVKSGGLGLILIKGLTPQWPDTITCTGELPAPFAIISKYLGRPDDIFECQAELIENGFEEYALL